MQTIDPNQVPYDRNATTVPDKNGALVAVGDYVRFEPPMGTADTAKVVSLRLREAHAEGNVSRKLGTLDTEHSGVDLEVYVIQTEPWPNVTGAVTSSRAPSQIERLDLTEAQLLGRRAGELEIALANIDYRLAYFNGERRRYERMLAEIRE